MGRTAPAADNNTPPRLRIRRARLADATALSRLALRLEGQLGLRRGVHGGLPGRAHGQRGRSQGALCLCSDPRRCPLGFYMFKMEGSCAEVWDFFMVAEAMGSGLGGRLWRHLEATTRRCGAVCIGVDSDPNAEGFYRKMGLRRCGEAPSLSIPGRMLPRLEKEL